MTWFTRQQVLELLEIEEGFLLELEEEEIVRGDAASDPARYSEQMLERARVAHNLVAVLEVNLPGAAIILRMRDEMAELRHRVEELAIELDKWRRPGAR
jgi:hypothetical protein